MFTAKITMFRLPFHVAVIDLFYVGSFILFCIRNAAVEVHYDRMHLKILNPLSCVGTVSLTPRMILALVGTNKLIHRDGLNESASIGVCSY